MKLHGNARTCPNSRRLLVERVVVENWSVTAAAAAAGVSERTVWRWVARFRAEGEAGLFDRSSRPKRSPRQLPAAKIEAIRSLRRLRMTAAQIAEVLALALSTVSRWLKRIGLGKRSQLEPPEPPNRYERRHPGELVHVDIKTLGRISRLGAGHRVVGHRKSQRRGHKRGGVTRLEHVHVMVDDHSRLAYAEVLPTLTAACGAWRRRLLLPRGVVVWPGGLPRRGRRERPRLALRPPEPPPTRRPPRPPPPPQPPHPPAQRGESGVVHSRRGTHGIPAHQI